MRLGVVYRTVTEAGRVNTAEKFRVSRSACSLLTVSGTVSFSSGGCSKPLANYLNVANRKHRPLRLGTR
jgi:hypothetical protein